MMMHPTRLVVRGAAAAIQPYASVTIAVDTAYVAAQQGRNINQGVYMMDNMASNGSTNEGQMELSTVVPVGSTIGFNSVPINFLSGDKVIISGFNVSRGNVFGSAGYPQQFPLGNEPPGSWWIGQAMNSGNQTYQLQIAVTVGIIRPVTYYVNWDPFITAR
jgi:hypothetical protein